MTWFSQPRIVWPLTMDSEEETKTLQLGGLNGIVQFTKKKKKNRRNMPLQPHLSIELSMQFMPCLLQTPPVKGTSQSPPWPTSFCVEISVPSL
jgi:hypothetical protein